MSIGLVVLLDQLCPQQSALAALEERFGASDARRHCRVLLIESSGSLERMPLHRQRLVLLWSALRHFVAELREAGWQLYQREAESFVVALLAS
jgi:deoxyribodipyrimidine photolyase-related protein